MDADGQPLGDSRPARRKSKKKRKRKKNHNYPATLASGEVRYYQSERKAHCARMASIADARNRSRGPVTNIAGPEAAPVVSHRRLIGPECGTDSPFSFYDRTTKSEQRFLRFAAGKGLQVHRNGWPDFFCNNPDGGMAAVEVKKGVGDPLSHAQVTCIKMLSDAGIETWIWNSQHSKHYDLPALIPWRNYIGRRLRADLSAKATEQATKSVESDLEDQTHASPVSEDGRIPEVLDDP